VGETDGVALAVQVGVGVPMLRASIEFPGDGTADATGAKREGCDAGDVVVSSMTLGGIDGVWVAGHKSRPTVGVGELHAADTKTRLNITAQPRSRIGEW
jgi:hypothetical protein